jgi:hypothetical protein
MKNNWATKAAEEIMEDDLFTRAMPGLMYSIDQLPLVHQRFKTRFAEIIRRHAREAHAKTMKDNITKDAAVAAKIIRRSRSSTAR